MRPEKPTGWEEKMKKKNNLFSIVLGVIALIIVYLVSGWLGGDSPEPVPGNDPDTEPNAEYVEYTFKNDRLLEEHFEKHGIEMGFVTAEEYEKAASDVVNHPDSLHKLEKEDGDDVYYRVETNEFVVVSKKGYIRTYFCPDSGKKYFDKQ